MGLDVGTTTSSMVVSRLTAQNKASSFAVPEMEITGEMAVLALPGQEKGYAQVKKLAQALAALNRKEYIIALEVDVAKALGQALSLLLPGRPILCIDKVKLAKDSYLDIGKPVGPALPVVVKTLVFDK